MTTIEPLLLLIFLVFICYLAYKFIAPLAAKISTNVIFSDFETKLAGMHKSWTIWFNALTAGVIPLLDYAQTNLPALKDYLPTNYYGYLMLVAVTGNIILRFKTNNSLADKVTNVQPPAP